MRKWLKLRTVFGLLLLAGILFIGSDPKVATSMLPFQTDAWHPNDLTSPPFPPSKMHWFGTDRFGHDIFSQTLYGILPTFRDATLLVVVCLAAAIFIAFVKVLFHVRIPILDQLTYMTTLVPPVLLAVLFLEARPIYFSTYSGTWYYWVIGILETGRLVPIVEGDIALLFKKPFLEGAFTAGGGPIWIFRKHVAPWFLPYLVEYVPTQYARILAVMGELGFFGIFTSATILQTQDSGPVLSTTELDWPALIAVGGHNWFTAPHGVLFPTLALCVLIFVFRLLASGLQASVTLEQGFYWPWPEKRRRTTRHLFGYQQTRTAPERRSKQA